MFADRRAASQFCFASFSSMLSWTVIIPAGRSLLQFFETPRCCPGSKIWKKLTTMTIKSQQSVVNTYTKQLRLHQHAVQRKSMTLGKIHVPNTRPSADCNIWSKYRRMLSNWTAASASSSECEILEICVRCTRQQSVLSKAFGLGMHCHLILISQPSATPGHQLTYAIHQSHWTMLQQTSDANGRQWNETVQSYGTMIQVASNKRHKWQMENVCFYQHKPTSYFAKT